jgi:hypothetical protein
VWKLSPALEKVAVWRGGAQRLVAPRDLAVPFAWVHDHRGSGAAPAWRGQGSALVLESWRDDGGLRLVDLGVDMGNLHRSGGTGVEAVLTDAAHVRAHVVDMEGHTTDVDFGIVPAGTQRFDVPALQKAARVTLTAESTYDPARRAEASLQLAAAAPVRLALHQNSPNPFNPSTTIEFELTRTGAARLDVFDVRGRRVRNLVQGALGAGTHSVVWDGRDARGDRAGSGIYFYRLDAEGASVVRKMVLAQ